MINFEKKKMIKNAKKNGISANEQKARQTISYLIEDMLKTQYSKNQIIKNIKNIATGYFDGLPEDLVLSELESIYENITMKKCIVDDEEKTITLYKTEMQIIRDLNDYELMKLAFSGLIYHKFLSQFKIGNRECYSKSVKFIKSDLIKIAELQNCSGKKQNELFKKLVDLGLFNIFVKINGAFKFNPVQIAETRFVATFNVNINNALNDEIYMKITDYDDLLLYLDYYLGMQNIILCADCGKPIKKTNNKKILCASCAEKRKTKKLA